MFFLDKLFYVKGGIYVPSDTDYIYDFLSEQSEGVVELDKFDIKDGEKLYIEIDNEDYCREAKFFRRRKPTDEELTHILAHNEKIKKKNEEHERIKYEELKKKFGRENV